MKGKMLGSRRGGRSLLARDCLSETDRERWMRRREGSNKELRF